MVLYFVLRVPLHVFIAVVIVLYITVIMDCAAPKDVNTPTIMISFLMPSGLNYLLVTVAVPVVGMSSFGLFERTPRRTRSSPQYPYRRLQ
ncbi:hypothetical protein V8E52_009186 [Russula decolorans]|jgi:hypothetical protein